MIESTFVAKQLMQISPGSERWKTMRQPRRELFSGREQARISRYPSVTQWFWLLQQAFKSNGNAELQAAFYVEISVFWHGDSNIASERHRLACLLCGFIHARWDGWLGSHSYQQQDQFKSTIHQQGIQAASPRVHRGLSRFFRSPAMSDLQPKAVPSSILCADSKCRIHS